MTHEGIGDDLRERFHVAKLSHFSILIQNKFNGSITDQGKVQKLYDQVVGECGFEGPNKPTLMHQGIFISFGFIAIVWLWEAIKRENRTESVIAELTNHRDWNADFFKKIQINKSGPRDIKNPNQLLRLLRNALSHADLTIEKDNRLRFSDGDGTEKTSLLFSISEFGKLADDVFWAINRVLYPDAPKRQNGKPSLRVIK